MTKRNDPIILESPDLASYISLTRNLQPRPFIRKSDRRVCFEFQEDVSDTIEEFYSNPLVPISDFCQRLKSLRSAIFNLKAGCSHAKK
jgi:hypothetical protein